MTQFTHSNKRQFDQTTNVCPAPPARLSPSCQRHEAVAQITQKTSQQMDIKNLNSSDLESLKEKDPFMYYSIPGVKDATLLLDDVDISTIQKSLIRRNCISCPSRPETQGKTLSTKVTRRTCISFECHTDLLMANMFDEEEEEEDDAGDKKKLGDEDYLDDLLMSLISMRKRW